MPIHHHLAEAMPGLDETERSQDSIRVVLVDRHAAVRRSVRGLLAAQDDLELLAEAADLATAMRLLQDRAPDVLVLDLPMPQGSSIEAIGELRTQVPSTAIIVLTMEASPLFAQQALGAGAAGFVLKDRADTELPAAIRAAAGGEEFVSSRVAIGLDVLRRAEPSLRASR
jgi:two-component system response regulator NreC